LVVFRIVARGQTGRGAMTDPPLLGVPALFVARLRAAHCVNWVQDIYPEVLNG
jgi:hypothetical protein